MTSPSGPADPPGTGSSQERLRGCLPRLDQSPVAREFVQDPYPFYAAARAQGDFFWWNDYDRVCASSHRAVNQLLRDRRWGREIPEWLRQPVPEHLRAFMDIEANSMLEIDPPRHTALRNLVHRAFTPRAIDALAPSIKELAEGIAGTLGSDEVDLLPNFADRIPVIVIARLLGVPDDMANQLLSWSHDMVAMYQARRDTAVETKAAKAAYEFSQYIENLAHERKARPATDLISRLLEAEIDGRGLTSGELVSTCILLLNAGHEATVHTIGNGVKTLLEFCERNQRDPSELIADNAIAGTVEELLRHDPPLHLFDRYAKDDVTVFGHEFRKGDKVALLLASANRDAAAFGEDAHMFRPERHPNRHLSFGAGVHFCLGAQLARLELTVSLQALFRLNPRLRMIGTPTYADCYHFHGLSALHVRAE